ncbi:MAG: 4Fe-4S binding protein [Desulfobacterales bacterium]
MMTDMSLYQKLADSIGFGQSERVPKMFAMIADEDEAKFILAAAPPATVEEIAERAGIPLEKAQKMVDPLFRKGLIFKSKKPGPQQYYKIRNFVQFHDGTVLAPDVSEEYLDMWREFEEKEMPAYHEMMIKMGSKPFMRVIPVNVTVESKPQVLASDDVTQMVDEAKVIAVTNCSCRTIHPRPEIPLQVCMQLDKAATYAIDRGTGKELTRQEALDLLKMCEEKGLVHTAMNTRGLGTMICNCDSVSCGNWPDKTHAKSFTAPSRFIASVDQEACSSCETCISRCFFDAVSLTGPNDTAAVDEEKCMGCGLCQVTCPEDAIQMVEIRPLESIPVE